MSLSTDLNQSPYNNDFDEMKNFYEILFKPAVAVQARELTQLQSILQNQISRFGDNILVEGTIIKGCNFLELRRLGYIKILDLQGNGSPVVMSAYKGQKAIGKTTGVEAVILEVSTGLESQAPDLNTLFVRYTGTGTNGEKVFSSTETIEVSDINTSAVIADVVAAGTVDTSSIGNSHGVHVSDGIIYQKGFFIRVDAQRTIVSKYSNLPDGVAVGFSTTEEIINSNNDTSLLDNAQGYPNENAPGADRLKLTPTLVVKTLAEAQADENFLALQEYENGRVVRRKGNTQYGQIFDEIRQRTFEESGNYTVRDFPIRISANTANSNVLDVNVGRGLAYVEGRRVDLLHKIDVQISEALDFNSETQQSIAANYGNYIIVNEYMGNFKFDTIDTVTLHNAPLQRFTAGSVGTNDANTQIGTARMRAVVHHDGTVGYANTQYRVYIFGINMNSNANFNDVRSIFYDGTNKGAADLVLEANNAVLKETNFNKSLFYVGRDAIKTIPTANTDYIYRNVDETLTADSATGQITINLSGTDEWPYGIGLLNNTQKLDIDIICNSTQSPYTSGVPIDLTSATVNVTSTQSMTITLPTPPASNMSVIAYYDVKKTAAAPQGKTLQTVYFKIDPNTHAAGFTGPYCLGVPDIFAIDGIWQGASYATTNTDVTNKFYLQTAQHVNYYGLSKIIKKRNHTISSGDYLLIKARVFQKNITGSYAQGFFSVDSYPIDDANTANTSAITTQEIPVYTTPNGVEYDLRNVIDFRPYAANTSAYSTTIAGATVNPSSTVTFGTTDLFYPSPNKVFEADYQYYIGRKDLLFVDSEGNFDISTGKSEENPAPPSDPDSGLVLCTINIPPYPSLPKRVADRAGKPEYGVTIQKRDNRRFTMKDIGGIERRVESLEYYTSLNSLEQDAVNLLVTDATGATRFKNGIFVDNFNDLNIANIKSTEFNAAIDPTYHEIIPKMNIYSLDLIDYQSSSWTGATKYDDQFAALTPSSNTTIVTQPYATTYRNCVTDFYSYTGQAIIRPRYDSGYDTVTAPDVSIDLTDSFSDFVDELSHYVPLSTVSRDVSRQTSTVLSGLTRTTTTSTTTTTKTKTLGITGSNEQSIGDFVTDVRFNPFMKPRRITIHATGLRPNTRHYFFFDGQDINNRVKPGKLSGGKIVKNGVLGASVTTDSTGTLYAIFNLPKATFYVGDRKLEIMDVDTLSAADASTSRCTTVYHAFNINVEKTGLSTQVPEIGESSNVQVSTSTVAWSTSTQQHENPNDPIAQTFMLDTGITTDNAIIVPKLDLFFKSKDTTKGVRIQLRHVENGYPTKKVVPGSSVFLSSSEVNVSDDGSIATEITFKKPIPLRTGKEFAIVVIPAGNSPNYNIFIGKTGQQDLVTGNVIVKDTNGGILFTSTNNRTWTPYQDENMKFTLYRSNYAVQTGQIQLTNNYHEFLTLGTPTGTFDDTEKVGTLNANSSGTIALVAGNNTILGTGTNFGSLQVGDPIAVYEDANTISILEVATITSNTQLTTIEAPSSSNTSTAYFVTTVGEIESLDTNEPVKMVLKGSTAKTGSVFVANSTVFGETSGATATITSVDNQGVSYLQPHIRRINTTATRTTLSANVYYSDIASIGNVNLAFNNNNYFNNNKTIIKSRSNEITDGTGKSFVLNLGLRNTNNATPIIDYETSTAMVYHYLINNDSTDETTSTGAANTKYVSETVELADGLDADDIKVLLTAYRPPNTNVEVYVRFKNTSDPDLFEDIPWTKLDLKSESDTYSSNANRFDYKEYEFNVPSLIASSFVSGGGAALNKSNNDILRYVSSDGTIYDRYKYYAIKIVLLSAQEERVPRIKDVRAIALS